MKRGPVSMSTRSVAGEQSDTGRMAQLQSYSLSEFITASERSRDFLTKFVLNSLSNYYTLKPEVDCRLYGIKDAVKTEMKRLWVTGMYSDRADFDFNSDEEEDPDFLYDHTSFRRSARFRIRPDYC